MVSAEILLSKKYLLNKGGYKLSWNGDEEAAEEVTSVL